MLVLKQRLDHRAAARLRHRGSVGQRLSVEVLQVEEGSLYPALDPMERRGWLSSTWATTDTAGGRVSTSLPMRVGRNWRPRRPAGED